MMTETDIVITKVERSKLKDINLENIPFGKYFTDHMLEADYENGEWKNVEIKPYQPILLEPSLSALHYGQSIFEGIKAYKNESEEAFVFRPEENFKRFNNSARRMSMPEVPEEIFMEGMRQLINLDKNWIPNKKDHSLYVRPFMFATSRTLGVRPSEFYKFLIILSPTGPYYSVPMKIKIEEKYTRACPGGVGFAKNAGNYGASMIAAAEARNEGYDQVLWTDGFEHKWLQEVGMMNVFFVIGDKVVTPSLEEGTILAGITRNSVITLLKEMGYQVEERKIKIDELTEAYDNGKLLEAFGTGTAATVAFIEKLKYRDKVMELNPSSFTIMPKIKKAINDIKEGRVKDTHNWMYKI